MKKTHEDLWGTGEDFIGFKAIGTNTEEGFKSLDDIVNEISADNIQIVSFVKNLAVDGAHTLNEFIKVPKYLTIYAYLNGGGAYSIATVTKTDISVMFMSEGKSYNLGGTYAIGVGTNTSAYSRAVVVINEDGTVTLTWSKAGTGGTGSATIKIVAHF